MAHDRLRLRRILGEMDRMLAQAMNGSFIERDFDESRLSAVETKLAHYLTASAVSARNLSSEKEAIEEVKLRSRQYAKRQLTWLRRNPEIHWIWWEKERDFAAALRRSTEILTAQGLG